ncbi:MAG: N-methyl-L-tryptophan oxidase [Caldilineaceae bacterium]
MRTDYDYIVLGCGGIGSAALYWLARRAGADVLGIEQFQLYHSNGGSQDYSRIIRHYYHKDCYARLTPQMYAAWATIAEESGVQPVTKTGGVVIANVGSPQQATVERYAESLHPLNIPYEWLDNDELAYRFPQFRPERAVKVCYQKDTGIADPSRGNAIHISLARGYGATLIEECPVLGIVAGEETPGSIAIITEQGTFTCRRLVIAAGAWTNQALNGTGFQIPLRVTQEQVTYFATAHLKEFAIGHFPIFQWKTDVSYYGFPVYGEVATKAAIDETGIEVTAMMRSFSPDQAREQQLISWLSTHIPHFVGPKLYTKTCLYTMPPDRDFVLDHVPGQPNIFVAIGAGHAYKFASLLGQILSELAIDGHTAHDISAFSARRPAILSPATTVIERYR